MIDPIPTARNIVAETIELRDGQTVEPYVVWFCYILGGWKALLSTPIDDGRYYEVTYDRAKGRAYVDTYRKEDNEIANARYSGRGINALLWMRPEEAE